MLKQLLTYLPPKYFSLSQFILGLKCQHGGPERALEAAVHTPVLRAGRVTTGTLQHLESR